MCMRASSGIVPRAAPKEGLRQDAGFFCYNLAREFSWSNAALVLYTKSRQSVHVFGGAVQEINW